MKSLCLILLLLSVLGCKHRGTKEANASNEGKWTVSGWYVRPEIQDREGDHWEPDKKAGGMTNVSASKRATEQGESYLKGFDAYIAARTDHELFDMLATTERSYNRAEYQVAWTGNEIILDELRKRSERDSLVFPREEDYNEVYVFTGSGGPAYSIADVIHGLQLRKKK
jgi:hypothetical protein